jgi:spermidine synthase
MRGKLPPQLPAVLFLGLGCQVAQIVLLRELLMVFYGNELSIGLILATWMVWVGAGSWLGSFVAEKTHRPLIPLALDAAAILLVLPSTILLIRMLRGFFDILPGQCLSFFDSALACFLLMAPLCSLLGAQYVLLSRVWRQQTRTEDASGAANTYIFEAVGSACGGLLFTLLLVRFLGSFQCAVLVSMAMLVGVAWLSISRETLGSQRHATLPLVFACLLVLSAVLFPFLDHLDQWAYRIQWQLSAPEHQLVATYQSKYGTISVVRHGDQHSFFRSGHLAFSTAGPHGKTPAMEEQRSALFAHLSMVQHRDPKRILLIGGGLRGMLREIARHPVEAIDYVELDRVLIEVAEEYIPAATMQALQDPRVRVAIADGRLHVRESDQVYDMIIVDLPDPATAAVNRFYTVEFFREARKLLGPEGVLVTGVTSAALHGSALVNRNATVYHTLRKVFSDVLPVGESFCYFFASDSPAQLSADVEVLRARYLARNVDAEAFSDRHLYTLLEYSQLRRMNWVLRHHGRSPDSHLAPPTTGPLLPATIAEQEAEEKQLPPVMQRYFINSDFRPIGYYYTLVLWNIFSHTRHVQAFDWILRVKSWWIVPIIGACLLPYVVFRGPLRGRQRDTHYAILLAIFTTGVSTMSFHVGLLFAFQSIYGFVYEMVGVVVAAFMGGLAFGAAMTNRLVKGKANTRALAYVQLVIALFAGTMALGLPLSTALTSSLAVFALFSLIAFLAGSLSGADFPLATACWVALTKRAERGAGLVYGVELLGACSGAVLAGVLIVPILGIIPCCLFAGLMNATAFAVVALSSLRLRADLVGTPG